MGLVVAEVTFDGPVPTARQIAEQMESLTGLPIELENAEPELGGDLLDLNVYMAFAGVPQGRIEMTAYRSGAVKKHIEMTGMNEFPFNWQIEGADVPGTQTVFLRGYVGDEPTVMMVATLALERLGGHIRGPISGELRREYDRRISVEDLARRHRKARRQQLLMLSFGMLMLPIWLLLSLLSIGWHLVKLPWQSRKIAKLPRRQPPQ